MEEPDPPRSLLEAIAQVAVIALLAFGAALSVGIILSAALNLVSSLNSIVSPLVFAGFGVLVACVAILAGIRRINYRDDPRCWKRPPDPP